MSSNTIWGSTTGGIHESHLWSGRQWSIGDLQGNNPVRNHNANNEANKKALITTGLINRGVHLTI